MKQLVLTAFVIFTSQLYAQSFEPGLWRYKENVSISGISLKPSTNEDCVSASKAKDAKASIEKELKKHGCLLTKWIVKNQKLDAAIKCKNDTFEAGGNLKGLFSQKSYDLQGEAEGTYMQALPATALIKLSGQWIKKCNK